MLQAAMSRWARPVRGAARGRVAAGSRREAGCLCEVQEASPAFLTWAFFAITPPRSPQQPTCPADGPQLLCGSQASPPFSLPWSSQLSAAFLDPAGVCLTPGHCLPPHSPLVSALPEGLSVGPAGLGFGFGPVSPLPCLG